MRSPKSSLSSSLFIFTLRLGRVCLAPRTGISWTRFPFAPSPNPHPNSWCVGTACPGHRASAPGATLPLVQTRGLPARPPPRHLVGYPEAKSHLLTVPGGTLGPTPGSLGAELPRLPQSSRAGRKGESGQAGTGDPEPPRPAPGRLGPASSQARPGRPYSWRRAISGVGGREWSYGALYCWAWRWREM